MSFADVERRLRAAAARLDAVAGVVAAQDALAAPPPPPRPAEDAADAPPPPPRQVLVLRIDRAAGLPVADWMGLADPFVVVEWDGDVVGTTQVKVQTCVRGDVCLCAAHSISPRPST